MYESNKYLGRAVRVKSFLCNLLFPTTFFVVVIFYVCPGDSWLVCFCIFMGFIATSSNATL